MNSSSINIGDILFQLSSLGFLALLIILVISYFRSIKKRKNQQDSMEEKLNLLAEEIKKLKK
jgi:preprotein translocase subunit YajC